MRMKMKKRKNFKQKKKRERKMFDWYLINIVATEFYIVLYRSFIYC